MLGREPSVGLQTEGGRGHLCRQGWDGWGVGRGREQGENRGSRHVMQQGLETARPPLPEAVSVPRCECVSVGMGAWVHENAAVYLWEYICVRTSECVCESAYVCEYACPSVSSMCVLVCV